MSYRWVLYDPVLNTTYTVGANPDKMSSPYPPNKTTTLGVSPIDGRSRAARSAPGAVEWTWSGVTFDKAHYDALLLWCAKPYRVQITDHLGRTWSVRLKRFDATPKHRTGGYRWKHRYTVTCDCFGRGITVVGVPATATAQILTAISVVGVAATASADAIPGALI